MDDEQTDESGEYKSRSQLKREHRELQELGEELVGLSSKQLDAVPIATRTREAIDAAQSMSRSALKRQLRHLARHLEHEDLDAIRDALAGELQPHVDEVNEFHELERWRDELIAGDDDDLMKFIEEHPQYDRQRLRKLVLAARREKDAGKPPKSARQLFQILKSKQS